MREKVREIACRDDAGREVTVIEWSIQPSGMTGKSAGQTEYTLSDGSPVSLVGGQFEHFYSGKLYSRI